MSRTRGRISASARGRPPSGRERRVQYPRVPREAAAMPRPWRVGRPSTPISNLATRLGARSRTADRTNAWWASVGCADTEPVAAAAPDSRELDCGIGSRERSGAEKTHHPGDHRFSIACPVAEARRIGAIGFWRTTARGNWRGVYPPGAGGRNGDQPAGCHAAALRDGHVSHDAEPSFVSWLVKLIVDILVNSSSCIGSSVITIRTLSPDGKNSTTIVFS